MCLNFGLWQVSYHQVINEIFHMFSRCLIHASLIIYDFLVFDASAKLPSGILRGNIHQYGDFDQCLSIATEDKELKGKFCLANVQLGLSKSSEYYNHLRRLMMGNEPYTSEFEDVRIQQPCQLTKF